MESGYGNLFNAIWVNAIYDDTQRAGKQLYNYAFDSAYETYSLNAVKPLDRNDVKLKDTKRAIHKVSVEMAQKLVPRIKELVYKEAEKWPYNTCFNKDLKYDSIFRQLREDVLEFAQEEMQKFQEANKQIDRKFSGRRIQ
jgi:hypothetical protein